MKPKINDYIWTIYEDEILLEKVWFLGEKSFLIDYNLINPEYDYDSYNKTWWKSFEKAKTEMRKRYGRNIKFKKISDGWWKIE